MKSTTRTSGRTRATTAGRLSSTAYSTPIGAKRGPETSRQQPAMALEPLELAPRTVVVPAAGRLLDDDLDPARLQGHLDRLPIRQAQRPHGVVALEVPVDPAGFE